MADEPIFSPEVIQEAPFPGQDVPVATGTQSNPAGVFSPTTSKEKAMPRKRAAVELLSQALNTRSRNVLQEFELVQSGGFRIGNFEEGISGDVRLTPNGMTARNIAGVTTFVLDGTTGNAVFAGEIRSGSVVTGQVVVGNNRVIIDIDENGEPQIIVNDGTYDRVLIGFGDF